jgi:kynurenine formamidase
MRSVTVGLAASIALLTSASVQAQQAEPSWMPPPAEERCPSQWGEGDERGSANHMSPDSVLKAVDLIEAGEVIELGHELHPAIPVFGTRRFDVHVKRTFMNPFINRRGSNEEIVITEIGQVGTQLDAFNHQTHEFSLYNCFEVDEVATRSGFQALGVENVGALIARGVLIDVAALKEVDILPDSYEITVEDLEEALDRQGLTLEPGDAVIIHTGWGTLWGVDNARYVGSAPGIGVEAALWLAEQDPMLVGADNWPVEVAPNPDPQLSLPVHQIMLVVNGILLLENLKLDELAAEEVHEFAFMMQPLKVRGGTGSTVAPIAVR